jgi:hypothetical protein
MFLLVEEPNFIVLLSIGTLRIISSKPSMSIFSSLSLWKDGAFPRLWRIF